jgi:hypothetical protein
MPYIKTNKIKCLHCGDIIISNISEIEKRVECSCGKCVILGGGSFLGRGEQNKDYKELSEMDNSKIPKEIKDN